MSKIVILEDVKFISVSLINILNELQYKDIELFEEQNRILNFIEGKDLDNCDIIFLSLFLNLGNDIQSGIELIKKIKAINNTAKIVVISSNKSHQDVLKAMQAGAVDVLEKPIKLENVKKVLDSL